MTDEAFLRAILDDPDDDAPRLVYADWLEERDDPRGEFIRLQCRLAAADSDAPGRAEAEGRVRALLARHRQRWLGPIAGMVAEAEFRRGFVEAVALPAADFLLARAEDLFRLAPVRAVRLYGPGQVMRQLAATPALARVSELTLVRHHLHPPQPARPEPWVWNTRRTTPVSDSLSGGLAVLLVSPFLTRLTALDLSLNGLEENDVAALVRSPCLARLTAVRLAGNHVGDAGARLLAEAPAAGNLAVLDLGGNGITGDGVAALAGSRYFAPTLRLSLGPIRLDGEGLLALARAGRLGWLLGSRCDSQGVLNLSGCAFGDGVAAGLAACPSLGDVKVLTLRMTRLTGEDVKALAGSPHLGQVTSLDLSNNSFGDAGAAELGRAEGMTALVELALRYNRIGDAGAAALARARGFPALRSLDLSTNEIGPEGAAALASWDGLAGVSTLLLMYNRVGDRGAAALAASPHGWHLETLDLRFNGLTDQGALALAASPHLGNVNRLVAWGNGVSATGAAALRRRFGGRALL
jgi:uncharacterized protein (TIGR02996 family)